VLLPTQPTAPESAYRVVEPLQNAAPERRVPPSWPERISAPTRAQVGRTTCHIESDVRAPTARHPSHRYVQPPTHPDAASYSRSSAPASHSRKSSQMGDVPAIHLLGQSFKLIVA
jgi:hypothetical protein